MLLISEVSCLVLAFIFLIFMQDGGAIKCWVCRSDVDPSCADPFNNTTVAYTDCKFERVEHLPNVDATFCRKIRQDFNGNSKYIRSCGFLEEPGTQDGEKSCFSRTDKYNISVEYCTCKKNLCNDF